MQTHTHDLSFTATEVRKRFVRGSDDEADREWRILNLLWIHAPGISPRPLRWEVEDGHFVVTMQRLPGKPLGKEPLTGAQTASLGHTLRQIYSIPTEVLLAAGIAERRHGPSMLPQRLVGWLREEHDFSQCNDAAQVNDAVSAAIDWLHREEILPKTASTKLGIADLNPANILWDGHTCRLVDFEDGGLTDPAYELADHVEHIAARIPGVFDPDALSAAVGLTALEHERIASYRPLWAAFWLVMLLPGNGGFRRNPPGTTEAQARHFLSLIDL